MPGLTRYAQFEGLVLQVFHKCLHAFGNYAEIVVVHLLVLGRVVPHEGSASEHEVWPGIVETLVDQEVLLLPAQVGLCLLHVGIEVAGHARGGLVYSSQRTQQGCLVVQRLAGI